MIIDTYIQSFAQYCFLILIISWVDVWISNFCDCIFRCWKLRWRTTRSAVWCFADWQNHPILWTQKTEKYMWFDTFVGFVLFASEKWSNTLVFRDNDNAISISAIFNSLRFAVRQKALFARFSPVSRYQVRTYSSRRCEFIQWTDNSLNTKSTVMPLLAAFNWHIFHFAANAFFCLFCFSFYPVALIETMYAKP